MSQIYVDAAQVVGRVKDQHKGLGSNFSNNAVFALASQTILFYDVLIELLGKAGVFADKEGKKIGKNLLCVMAYDLLLSEGGSIRGGGKSKSVLLSFKTRLASELARLKIARRAVTNEDLLPETVSIASFARLNRVVFRQTSSAAVEMMEKEFELKFGGVIDPGSEWERLLATQKTHFYADAHLSDLFVFGPAVSTLGKSKLVESGVLILQQKSSCFPAVLAVENRTFLCGLDACAAPGNKTCHLLACLGPAGKVFACEKDEERSKLLKSRMEQLGCSSGVEVAKVDFLSWTPPDEAQVAVCDPSCSGSGMVQRGGPQHMPPGRLEALASFQQSVVLHAMSFRNVKRVVYSTCSIHEIENEGVVRSVLAANKEFALNPCPMPIWPSRGLGDDCKGCIRVDAATHRTIGFFVAVFDRIANEERQLDNHGQEPEKKKRKKKKNKNKNKNQNQNK